MHHRQATRLKAALLCAAITLMAIAVAASAQQTLHHKTTTAAADKTAENRNNSFVQYNATKYLYRTVAPIASWPSLPLDGPIGALFFIPCRNAFLGLLENEGPVFVTVEQGVGAITVTPWNATDVLRAYAGAATVVEKSASSVLYYSRILDADHWLFVRCEILPPTTASPPVCTTVTAQVPVLPAAARPITRVNDVAVVGGDDVDSWFVGTDGGLVVATVASTASPASVKLAFLPMHNTTYAVVNDSVVHRLFLTPDKATLFAATRAFYWSPNVWTAALVHTIDVATVSETYYYRAPGIVDAIPNAFVEDAAGRDGIHMINEVCDNFLSYNGTMLRIAGVKEGGLPQGNLTTGASNPVTGNVWFGGVLGAMVLEADGAWKYFFGPRWLPGTGFTTGMNVSALAVGNAPDGSEEWTLVATDQGVSLIRRFEWASMDAKADYYQAEVPIFSRYGLMSQLNLVRWGDVNSAVQTPTANDGLWSSLALASQAFRFAATGDDTARANAWAVFDGMQMLINVTGDLKYPSRNFFVWPQSTPCPPSSNYRSTTMPDFCWNGDTSSDEIVGHLHVYPLMYLLVAQTAEEKARVLATIERILGGILDNNYTLIDAHTHKPTTWGRWDPATINGDPEWYDDRGVNSLQILTYLTTAYAITENPRYADAFYDLVDNHHYDINVVDLKITQPSDINYSDDELTFLPYLSFLFGATFAANGTANPLFERLKGQVLQSIQRTHAFIADEKLSLFNLIYLMAAQAIGNVAPNSTEAGRKVLADSVWCMETYTVSYVDWPTNNMNRLDATFPIAQETRNGGGTQALVHTWTLFPYDETTVMRWNSNPFRTEQGSGTQGLDPSPFLYPFWLGRYFQMW